KDWRRDRRIVFRLISTSKRHVGGERMDNRVSHARGAISALIIASMLVLGLVVVPGSVTGWAATPTTFIWGKSGDADTLDNNVSSNGETSEVTTQIFNLLVRAKPGQTDV